MIHTSTNTLDRTGLAVKPTGADEKKAYSMTGFSSMKNSKKMVH